MYAYSNNRIVREVKACDMQMVQSVQERCN